MVVSTGEESLALDSLARARAWLPDGWPSPALVIADNTVDGFLPADQASWSGVIIHRVPDAPRPYYQIARTVAGALHAAAKVDGELVIKIDPDTAVCTKHFFNDLDRLHQEARGEFYSWMTRYNRRANSARLLRLLADCLPVGWSRSSGGDRYGKRLTLRIGPAWHACVTAGAMVRGRLPLDQPSGGGYAVSRAWLLSTVFRRWATAAGPNGLEWNDDTLLPIAVAASGGRIVDVRSTDARDGWRWMHGSRYFGSEEATSPGLRALHPLKDNPADWAVRRSLSGPSDKA